MRICVTIYWEVMCMQQIMTEKVAHKLTNQTTNNKRKTDRHNICEVVCYYYGY